jgi:hypothetical protein
MRAFLDLVPASCEQVRASISGDIAAIELIPEWRAVTSGDSIAAATAPPPPPWAANPEAWPSRITNDMLLQQPANEQIQRLHPVRAVERERAGAVIMEGRALADGTFVWRIVGVSPTRWGFEDAAWRVGALYRTRAAFEDGRTTVGAPFFVVLGFTRTSKPFIQY